MNLRDDWGATVSVTCVSCPECGFTFDAFHTDPPTDSYSCPCCAEVALRAERDAALADLANARTTIEEDLVYIRRAEADLETAETNARGFSHACDLLAEKCEGLKTELARMTITRESYDTVVRLAAEWEAEANTAEDALEAAREALRDAAARFGGMAILAAGGLRDLLHEGEERARAALGDS